MLFGAAWSVYDTATIGTWVGDEIAFARSAVSLGVPVLGICFGGQLLAAALGGSVSAAPTPEIGWIPVSEDPSGLIEPGPWFSWHFDRFTAPPTAAVLSRTALADQAFCAGRSLGLQFHPEVNEEVLDTWLRVGGYDQLSGLDIDAEALLEQTRTAGRRGRRAHNRARPAVRHRRGQATGRAAARGYRRRRRGRAMRRFSHRRGSDCGLPAGLACSCAA